MHRNPLAVAALLAALATALDAGAVCTAANPNPSVIESTPTSAFIDHGNGTVTHNLTGLMWKQCAHGLSGTGCAAGVSVVTSWSDALSISLADTTAGYTDWRLPNKMELESIIESCGFQPSINRAVFPNTFLYVKFWTGSSYFPDPANAWYVDFNDGSTSYAVKSPAQSVFLLLVRGGQSFGAFDAAHPLQSSLDIDGNGAADALTDGLLVLRYLFGLRGTALIQGAVGTGAQRPSAAEIQTFLQALLPP